MMDRYDAVLTAIVIGVVTLALFLFLPLVIDDLPDIARTSLLYGAVLVVAGWAFGRMKRKPRK